MLTVDECQALIAMPKVATKPLTWVERSNHRGHKECVCVLVDEHGITAPGLTAALEVKAPIVTAACLYLFTIRKMVHGRLWRVYQLEVCPPAKRSHNGKDGALYGPHEHVGEHEIVRPVTHASVACSDWTACFAWFCQRCNLQAPSLDSPC